MSLIVENGAGLNNAESYCSVAFADAYQSARGNATWVDLDEEVKEQCLRRATDHIEQQYSESFKGCRVKIAQALSWPRYDAIVNGFTLDSNVVPVAVANACAEYAARAFTETLSPDLEGQLVTEKTIGPITLRYDTASGQRSKTYQSVQNMLAPYLSGGRGNVKLMRG